MSLFLVREFGILTTGLTSGSIDAVTIPADDYSWLKKKMLDEPDGEGKLLHLTKHNGIEALQVKNKVGLLQTPSGNQIEILPKDTDISSAVVKTRHRFWKMLTTVMNIPAVTSHHANLDAHRTPLLEILISLFLEAVQELIKRGVRSDYRRVQEEKKYLKSRLLISKQIRQRPGKDHFFHIEHQIFSPDRPENRLLKSTLSKVLHWTSTSRNSKLCRELLFVLADIPSSTNIKQDFNRWSKGRDLVHYRPVEPWCQLILNELSPYAMVGEWEGISMLFPMERLFEDYVAIKLRRGLAPKHRLIAQASRKHLVNNHQGSGMFMLKPDILIEQASKPLTVLDTKWKLIDSSKNNTKEKYGLSQADLYQLFAYGMKYLGGSGELYLVFPKHRKFQEALPPFQFDNQLTLWAIPYDLDADCLIGVDPVWLDSKLSA